MPCYHPLKAFKIGTTPQGKSDLKVFGYSADHLEQYFGKSGPFVPAADSSISPYCFRVYRDFVEIPCGKCIGCRLEYSRQWANRCMLELGYHESSYFVTLTYNPETVPVGYHPDPDTGEAIPSLTLRKRDLQLFFKRLRKHFGDGIRYYAAGEYGDDTYRPHYHAIIFGLKLNDLKLYKQNRGFNYYNSDSLSNIWSFNAGSPRRPDYRPFGHAVVAPVTWETCAYTARYVVSKLKGPAASFYHDNALEPPFTLMSLKPGIAYQWFVDHPDYRDYEYISLPDMSGGRKFRPPKYYDYLFDLDLTNASESATIKARRRELAERSKQLQLDRTNLTYLEYLNVKEHNALNRAKKLLRSDL